MTAENCRQPCQCIEGQVIDTICHLLVARIEDVTLEARQTCGQPQSTWIACSRSHHTMVSRSERNSIVVEQLKHFEERWKWRAKAGEE